MDPTYIPLLSGLSALGGAVIAGAASVIAIVVQAKMSERRERVRQAAMLAIEELKLRIPHLRGGTIFPVAVYVDFQLEVLKALERSTLTPERLRQIERKTKMLATAFQEIEDEARLTAAGVQIPKNP